MTLKLRPVSPAFLTPSFTGVLKGLCCLIVFMVHVPEAYSHPLQRALGSFAYVGVTLFFLVSAYGMMHSLHQRPGYLRRFWRGRLCALLIPCLVVNAALSLLGRVLLNDWSWQGLLYIDHYVLVLLQWCLWFFVVQASHRRWFPSHPHLADALLILGVTLTSLLPEGIPSLTDSTLFLWSYERMGLVWGILLYRLRPQLCHLLQGHRGPTLYLLLPLVLLLGFGYLRLKALLFWGSYLLKVLLGAALLLLLFTCTCSLDLGSHRLGRWLGRISFEFYLGHTAMMRIVASLLPALTPGCFIALSLSLMLALATLLQPVSHYLVQHSRPS